MSDHNTLDDLVRVATAGLPRCTHWSDRAECGATALQFVGSKPLCDVHAAEWQAETKISARDSDIAPAIRRLVAAGVLK